MRKLYISIFCLLFTNQISAQTTVILNPSTDNSIYQDFPGNSNGAGVNIFAGNTLANSPRRALLRFNFSSIPTNVTITSVTLTLNCNKAPSSANFNMSLHVLNENWGEGSSNAGTNADGAGAVAMVNDATWPCAFSDGAGGCNSTWSVAGGTFNASPSATTAVGGLGNYSWSGSQLASDVQNWIANPSANFGWILRGDETQSTTVKRFGSKENGTLSQRPSLSITYNFILPVSLSFFSAQETKMGNLLRWQTAQEINNAFFNIEHSADGIQFKKSGTIMGKGNSAITNDYRFTHNDYEVGKNFYRLSQIDFNGRVTYSPIIAITNSKSPLVLLISPNPVRESINLKTALFTGQQYQVYDITGKPVLAGKLTGSSILLTSQLQAGSYYIRIYKKDGTAVSGGFIKL
ncbi:MAG: DNRLRE domain-containing protein [Ferruginibacter sp.]